MKNRAFTLIELLVVVLIIGILAAIAVPQYQKAVERTRATQIIPLLKSIAEAENVYYLNNGRYASNLNDLDISTDNPYDIVISASSTSYSLYAATKYVQIQFSSSGSGRFSCWAKDNEIARNVCSLFGEKTEICSYCTGLGNARCCLYH